MRQLRAFGVGVLIMGGLLAIVFAVLSGIVTFTEIIDRQFFPTLMATLVMVSGAVAYGLLWGANRLRQRYDISLRSAWSWGVVNTVMAVLGLSAFYFSFDRLDMPQQPPPDFPEFPWPPPTPSAEVKLNRAETGLEFASELGDVECQLDRSLSGATYTNNSFLGVPDGFVLMTQVEQIEADGRSKEQPNRWVLEASALPTGLLSLLRGAVRGNPGRYRTFVFVVTPHPFGGGPGMPFEEANQFFDAGYNRLPDEVAGKPFTDAFEVSVLVYEYAQLRLDGENEIVIPSRYDGLTHLEQAAILGELTLSHGCDGTVHP